MNSYSVVSSGVFYNMSNNNSSSIKEIKKVKNVKKRNWAFVLYPESAPDNWKELLQLTGLQCAISPLHNKDIDPNGEAKKEHYHIILCYSGPTSYNVVKGLTDSLNQPIPQALEQIRGYYRYLTHKDNPDKYQYEEKDIESLNGFNIYDFIELTRSEVGEIKRMLHCLIRKENFIEYADLLDYLLDNEMFNEYDVASNNTLFFDKLLTSRRHKVHRNALSCEDYSILHNEDDEENEENTNINIETGEILD